MTKLRWGRSRQSGQAIVLVAGAMVALITMTALILMGGTVYWDRRHLQELADSAALAGSLKIGFPCDSTQAGNAMTQANTVIGAQLGAGGGSWGGSCAAGYSGTYTYPNSFTAIINYPYQSDSTKVEVILQQVSPLEFVSFLGVSNTTVKARAVAKNKAGTPSSGFAIFAKTSVGCQGASEIQAAGSIYSHDSIQYNGQCRIYAKAVPDPNGGYDDYGNIQVWQDGNPVSDGCPHICSDGYHLGGHAAPNCQTASSQYLGGAEAGNPNPCASANPPAVPDLGYPAFPDPNSSAPNGTPSSPKYKTTGQTGCDQAAYNGSGGFKHLKPGCYTTVDVSTYGGTLVLDPGFYFFGANGGSGVCLNGNSRLLGKDVTLEFVGGSNMTSLKCGLNGACGSACGFGNDPSAPPCTNNLCELSAPDSSSTWCTGSCPLQGLLVYQSASGTGSWLVKGPGESSWFKGTIFWPSGQCTWWANGTSTINGQLVCQSVYLQGGASSSGAGVNFSAGAVSLPPVEAALIE